ncbi:Z1 domain-containing protein [Candidatus Tokpelaia sp.]|uniref:Z1 domain-containing protein n=1 Tax=Candidatus Tokpelaia sp. TaxID=2233777 RepID=UPI001239E3C7|nr:Z1 domain-containing protein [Candidatus Tokpelaia sp.]KAA6405800.1 endonuclease [Candidatus Tokpelaia sp.]
MPEAANEANLVSDTIKELLVKKLMSADNLERDQIIEAAQKSVAPFGLSAEQLDAIVDYVCSRLVHSMKEGVSLIDNTTDHDENWPQKRQRAFNYWDDYKKLLLKEEWHPRVVNTLGDVTDKILGLLKDPADASEKNRRGLVIGHVQSGKTANYIGLVTKAADAGYKFIIVIAGIHNNLRRQTQQRIDLGFTGRDSTPEARRRLTGVGQMNKNRRFPVSLTNTSQDFTRRIAHQLGAGLQGFSQPVIVVIKKNVKTLQSLFSWLKNGNTFGGEQITDIPMLMIDDEADNASINTNREDLDPTKTNQEIRRILKLFKKHCYVGYTATPYANIFINPDSENEMLKDDLFPRDFIYCLDAPTDYFGAHRVFLDEEKSGKILETIEDAEPYIPINHKTKDYSVKELPPSLYEAIRVFVLAKAIRRLRGQAAKHTTMMVNLSRFVNVQRQVRDFISFYLEILKREVRYNHSLPVSAALQNKTIKELKTAFDDFYADSGVEWPDVQRILADATEAVKTVIVNSRSDEALDYKKASDNKESLTAIAVGGLSLSRGLTLEGLTVSYMYRNTKMYDTLMQMGRWFGYRPGYEDLCKVWLSDDSQGWYEYIAEATEELRSRIKQMRRDGLTPKEFGLYVRAHHGVLTVTAANKMRDAELRPLELTFSGDLRETYILPSEEEPTANNQEAVRKLYGKLEARHSDALRVLDGSSSLFWESVNWELAHDFLREFRYHRSIQSDKMAVLDYLKAISRKYPMVDIAFHSLKIEKPGQSKFELDSSAYILCQERAVGSKAGPEENTRLIRQPPEEAGYYVTNKQRVASRGAEIIGLPPEKIRQAREMAANDGGNMADKYYRFVRGRPLLMIHALDLVYKPARTAAQEILLQQVPAIGLAFPDGDYKTTIPYIVNKVWIRQNRRDGSDDLDNEEDYDE